MDIRRFPIPVTLSRAAFAAALLPALASAGGLTASAPEHVRPLQRSMRVTLEGAGAFSGLETPRVFVDGVERTSLAGVELVAEDAFDFDIDGDVDSTRVSYEVQLGALGLAIGDVLEVELGAGTAQGPELVRASSRVESHVDVRLDSAIVLSEAPVSLYLEWSELPLAASAVLVRIAGYDVTPFIGIAGPELVYEDAVQGHVVTRVETYELDFSALAGFGLEGLPISVEAWGGTLDGRLTSDAAASYVATDKPLTDCHKDALKAFCAAMKLSKNAAGEVCSGATAADQKKAADALQAALRACETPFPDKTQPYDCNGTSIRIFVGGTGQDAAANGKADAVIAIGGDAAAGGNGDGGDAKATNSQPGGAAIGIGGDGGSGSTSGGNGGDGSGTATNGTNGSPQGCASGVGGNGGTPTPPEKLGGNGGDGTATTSPKGTSKTGKGAPGTKGKAASGSNPAQPGTHGSGGSAHATGNTGSPSPGTASSN